MGKRGKGRTFLGKISRFKKRGWGRISNCRELYKPQRKTTLGFRGMSDYENEGEEINNERVCRVHYLPNLQVD